ncbi:hypothetical protein BDB00DRAFT_788711 [Zychaea mexicana]|uniref:uncharacterized protein n=1 Tax=Zychaea mexicana TaxID=64656 RepID=UPI0022FE701C|nr:uncharacterized protein BDB00DRAFT_788711 [Zychaea mexicana]KAI9492425.1 hypothetical protein BDB00DRAFT_788711 [Zychaea mexicana]
MLTRTTSPAGAGNVGAGGPLSWLMRCVERNFDFGKLLRRFLGLHRVQLWSGKQWQNELHGFIAAYSGYNEWEPKQNNVLWVHQEPFDNNLIRDYLQNEQDPSIADFVDKNLDFITQNTPFGKSADRFWSGIIQKQAHQLNKALFIDVHKKDFWLLDSTKAQAAEEGTDLVSVEEKVMDFALKCDFYHPSQRVKHYAYS